MSLLKRLARSVTLISSPYHVGIHGHKVGAGPDFLKAKGLTASLRGLGVRVDEVELEPVEGFEGDIGRSFELIRRTSAAVSSALKRGSFPVLLAGNCSASVGVAAGFNDAADESAELACAWFDAHDDYNTPDTVLSGYFDSQPIAMLGGECWKALLGTVPGFRPMELRERLVHVGMRDVNDLERKRVEDAELDVIWGGKQEGGGEHVAERVEPFAPRLREVLDRKRAFVGPTMVHLDLDCLDVQLGRVNQYSVPGGLLENDLLDCLDALVKKTRPVSLTVASFDPSYEGADNIARIAIAAIVKMVRPLVAAENA